MSKPWVTIVTPVYNGWEWLGRAAEGVAAQEGGWEWLIGINGHGPTGGAALDHAASVAGSIQGGHVRVMNLPDVVGKVEALNALVAHAQGEWIAVLDCDDWWEPQKLAAQRAAMEGVARGCAVIGTLGRYVGEMESDGPALPLGWIPAEAVRESNPVLNSSALIRRDLAIWIDAFGLEDYDMWVRITKAGFRMFNVPMRLIAHRIHRGSAFNGRPVQQLDAFRAFHWGNKG